MRNRFTRLLAASGAALVLSALATAPAHALVDCAPDPWEIDDVPGAAAAPIAPGETAHRAICQERDPLPGKTQARDVDWFEFTAVEGQAYTAEAVQVGAGLVNNADRGGLGVGFHRVEADGSLTSVEQNTSPNGDRSTSVPLSAGAYRIGAATSDQQVYPKDNVLATKTVQGADGLYGIRLTATAPPPVLSSLTISPNAVKGGDTATATLVFSSPVLKGGTYFSLSSNDLYVANPTGSRVVPEGTTTVKIPVNTRRVPADTPVTFTGQVVWVGDRLTDVLTVHGG
ncbi:hypothetical protein [Actinosynnema mirum]|uniref:Uncharacterized protein n=1 Tax=Actinosynnema mirum (strain ATCC 29888 / DSM 43827 / JCM 3225 / NBRC 14064 / NCIMB 13271 / NRRL B-12336 / IMRU 3971 / 101) TaxID=446462 RepID=C6WMT6_ACTMD|nr:hypothetical protein [Actinosynnema mirum]ACU38449.1 hypothetical protein Amir_4616 [Actinosynnema mirum DSM 43827]